MEPSLKREESFFMVYLRHWLVFPETRYENLIKTLRLFLSFGFMSMEKGKNLLEDFWNEECSYFWRKFDQKYKEEQCSYDLEWPSKHPSDFIPKKIRPIVTKQHFFPCNTRRTLSYHIKRENMSQITMKFLSLPSKTDTSKNLSLLALWDFSE